MDSKGIGMLTGRDEMVGPWLDRFDDLYHRGEEHLMQRCFDEMISASICICIEAMAEPACELVEVLRAAGHAKASAAMALPDGWCMHAVDMGRHLSSGLMLSREHRQYAVVIDCDVNGRPAVIRMSKASLCYVAMGAMADALARDMASARNGDTVVGMSRLTWRRHQDGLEWSSGPTFIMDDDVWPDVCRILAKAFVASGLAGTWNAEREAIARRTYRSSLLWHGAAQLGHDLAKDRGLVVDEGMFAVLSSVASRMVEPGLVELAMDIEEAISLCRANEVTSDGMALRCLDEGGRLSMDGGALVMSRKDGRMRVTVDVDRDGAGRLLRLDLSARPLGSGRGWLRSESVTFTVRNGKAVIDGNLDPFGPFVSGFELLRMLVPTCTRELAETHVP